MGLSKLCCINWNCRVVRVIGNTGDAVLPVLLAVAPGIKVLKLSAPIYIAHSHNY